MSHLQKTRQQLGKPGCAVCERGSYRETLIAEERQLRAEVCWGGGKCFSS